MAIIWEYGKYQESIHTFRTVWGAWVALRTEWELTSSSAVRPEFATDTWSLPGTRHALPRANIPSYAMTLLTPCSGRSLSREAASSAVLKAFPGVLQNPKVQRPVHNSPLHRSLSRATSIQYILPNIITLKINLPTYVLVFRVVPFFLAIPPILHIKFSCPPWCYSGLWTYGRSACDSTDG
jgi:hypothetical protein